jgi:hypothetical protein
VGVGFLSPVESCRENLRILPETSLLLSACRHLLVVQFIAIVRVKFMESSNHIEHKRKFRLVQYNLTRRHGARLVFPPNVFLTGIHRFAGRKHRTV